ncbi:hypothetical protein Tco_1364345 [Tanacetum coccineum]
MVATDGGEVSGGTDNQQSLSAIQKRINVSTDLLSAIRNRNDSTDSKKEFSQLKLDSVSAIQKRINVSTDVFSAIQNRNDSTER